MNHCVKRVLATAATCLLAIATAPAAPPEASAVIVTGLGYPEGTIFVGETLWFVDYQTSGVLRLDGGKIQTVWHQTGCGANGLVRQADNLIVACYSNGTIVRISHDGRLLKTIAHDEAGQTFNRPNDLAADARGGIYFSASGAENEVPGKVFYLSRDDRVQEVATGIHNSNGLAVSLDGSQLYVAESDTDRIFTYKIAADGKLSARRKFVNIKDLLGDPRDTPDGVRIDAHGRLFVGLYFGGGFAVIGPDGKLVARVDIPGPHHANLAISPDGRSVTGTTAYDQPGGSFRGELYRVANPVAE